MGELGLNFPERSQSNMSTSRQDFLIASLKNAEDKKALLRAELKKAEESVKNLKKSISTIDKEVTGIYDELIGKVSYPILDAIEEVQAQEVVQTVEPRLECVIPVAKYRFERVGDFAVIHCGSETKKISLEDAEHRLYIRNPHSQEPTQEEIMENGWKSLISLTARFQDELWDSLEIQQAKRTFKSKELIGFERVFKRGNSFDCVFFYQGRDVYELSFDKIELRLIGEDPANYRNWLDLCDKAWTELLKATQADLSSLIEGLNPRSSNKIAWKIEEPKSKDAYPATTLLRGMERRPIPFDAFDDPKFYLTIPSLGQPELKNLWDKLEKYGFKTELEHDLIVPANQPKAKKSRSKKKADLTT